MAEVLFGDKAGDRLVVSENKTQAYGLSGNDTLFSDGKNEVLLIGGSGDDSLIMTGGVGTLSGGKGNDTFEFTYSADKPISAVIEDLDPLKDKIIVNFDGDTAPKLSRIKKGKDVVWKDADGLFNVTLKGVRDNDYFDGTISEDAWEVLKITNDEREKRNLPALTLSDGLTKGAATRAQEITEQGSLSHVRPDGTNYFTVLNGKYNYVGENLEAVAATPEEVMVQWIASSKHYENILNKKFGKLGVGYNYNDEDESNRRYYWAQMFADSLNSPETISAKFLSTASIEKNTVSKFVTLTENTYSNSDYGMTIQAGGGNDSISNTGAIVSISGGAGSDSIENGGANATVNAGNGDDFISNSADNVLFQYAAGNDTIQGFNENSTLSISGDEYTPATVGNDVVVAVGNDSIKLLGAADLESVNIDGTRSKVFIFTDVKDKYINSLAGARIEALGGNDIIFNSGSSATVNSGSGNDSISNDSLGTNSTLNGGNGDDTVDNKAANVTINGDAGNDIIYNGEEYNYADSSNVSINGGAGNDTIRNTASNVSVDGGEGADSIYSSSDSVIINSGDGSDSIVNSGNFVSINGGANYDVIINEGDTVTIAGDDGNDTILNGGYILDDEDYGINYYAGSNVSMSGGAGNDYIYNSYDSDSVTISGGDGNDTIYSDGTNFTINGGTGDDLINLSPSVMGNNLIVYNSGDGNDYIEKFGTGVALSIAGGNYIRSTIGNDLVFYVDTGSITLVDGARLATSINVIGEGTEGTAYGGLVELNENNAVYHNTFKHVTIVGGDEADSISNSGDNVNIYSGKGNDFISNSGDGVAIKVWNNDDHIYYHDIKEENDGDDYIENSGSDVSINAGRGNDQISLSDKAQYNFIEYDEGDGSDTISGFKSNDTLSLSWVTNYSSQTIGNDIILNVGTDSITLLNATGLSSANIFINWSQPIKEDNIITLTEYNDNYYTFSNVSIDAGAGNDSIYNWDASNVTIDTGDGNDTILNREATSVTIKGGDGDDSIENRWESSNVSIDAGAGNDSIYNWNASNVTINGGDDNDEIYNDGDNVSIDGGEGHDTISNNADNVTINGGAGHDSIRNYNSAVSIDGGDDNDEIYNDGDNVSITGGEGNDYISNEGDNVTIDSGDDDDFIDNWDSSNVSILCGAGNDSIRVVEQCDNVSIDAGAGNDRITLSAESEHFISYKFGDGNDSIWGFKATDTLDISGGTYTVTVSGDDVIYKVGNGSIVLKNFRPKPEHDVLGESGTSGGTSSNSGNSDSSGGNSASGSSGNGNGSNSSSSNTGKGSTSSGSTDSSNGNGGSSGNGNGTVGQIVDNVVDFSNTPSTPEVIDRRGVKEFEAISGSNNPDSIYAGDGGASLWGGNGFASDTLVGGLGKDIFVCGKNQGADLILNAAPKDTIFFNDATLDDIISATENNLTISITFNTGNVVTIKSPELLSAKLQLADGNAYRFNHMGRTWQKA